MRRFERKRTIFANKDALRESYQPDRIQERDEEIDAYMDALQPVIDGWEPNNIFLYGNTGVGKTAVTEYLLERLREDAREYDDIDLSVLTLNCKPLSSSYQVAVELVNELRPDGGEISTTGYPQQTVFNKLYEEIDAVGGTVLLVLDEIDSIGEKDELLYELPRARSKGDLTEAKVGIVGISNDFKFRDQLDPRVQDTLCERELQFPPYNAQELSNILASRAEIALRDDVYDDAVVRLCAALAAKDRGSARQALDLLLLAGEQAQNNGDEFLEERHVEQAQHELERERVEEGIRQLTQHGHLALLAVVSLARAGRTPERSRNIYDRYLGVCDAMGVDSLAQRSVHNHLSDLRMLGILTARENRSGSRGNFYSYELDVPLESASRALEDELGIEGGLERATQAALGDHGD